MADWDAGTVPTSALFKAAAVNWTPVVTAETGTITTATVNAARVQIMGKIATLYFRITVTTAGTGAGALLIAGLPYTINATTAAGVVGACTVGNVSGNIIPQSTSQLAVRKYDGTTLIATGALIRGSLTYEAA